MKLRPTVKLITRDILTKMLPVYYLIMIIAFIFLYLNGETTSYQASRAIGSTVTASSPVVFFLILLLTPQTFRFLTQMGVSRRTQIKANARVVLILSAVIALADRLLCLLGSLIVSGKQFEPVSEFAASDSRIPFYAMIDIGLGFSLRLLAVSSALLISMLLMRMGLLQKVFFCLITALVFFVAWHDYLFCFFDDLAGENPFIGMLFLAGTGLICFCLYIISARKMPIRD